MRTLAVTAILIGSIAALAGCVQNEDGGAGPAASSAGDGAFQAQVLKAYDDKPFRTTNDVSPANTPEHSWLLTGDDTLIFVHWDHAEPAKAKKALFVGEGVKGGLCLGEAGITADEYDAGYVHFHTATAPNWDAGHNNGGDYSDASVQGWWLRHVGAQTASMEMMGMQMDIAEGEVFLLMPADKAALKACPAGHGHGGAPGGTTFAQLQDTWTFEPFTTTDDVSEHNTPEHLWYQVGPDRLALLHFNNADVSKATGLMFVGDGIKGRLCLGEAGITQAEYDAGFVHFHTAVAPNWDAGHSNGGDLSDPSVEGWWLRHVGAMTASMTMMGMTMNIVEGEVFPLMPTPVAELQACA